MIGTATMTLPTAEKGYLAQTKPDEPCKRCGECHGYLTRKCVPVLWTGLAPTEGLFASWPAVEPPRGLMVEEVFMGKGGDGSGHYAVVRGES
jgi:hypothetical protein